MYRPTLRGSETDLFCDDFFHCLFNHHRHLPDYFHLFDHGLLYYALHRIGHLGQTEEGRKHTR